MCNRRQKCKNDTNSVKTHSAERNYTPTLRNSIPICSKYIRNHLLLVEAHKYHTVRLKICVTDAKNVEMTQTVSKHIPPRGITARAAKFNSYMQ